MSKPGEARFQPGGVASPCVRQCCLNQEDVCLGCFRHVDEITGWLAADDTRRLAILARARQRRLASGRSGF